MSDKLQDLVKAFETGGHIAASRGNKKILPEAAGPKPAAKSSDRTRALPFPLKDDMAYYQGCVGSVFVFGSQRTNQTALIDLAGVEPSAAVLDDFYALSADFQEGKGWLFCGRSNQGGNRAIVVADPFRDPAARLELPPYEDERRIGIEWAAWIGGEAVLWAGMKYPFPYQLPAAPWHPLVLDGKGYRSVGELPPIESGPFASVCKGRTRLGDGKDVLVWQDKGYELEGKGFIPKFDFKITNFESRWTSVACGQDGLYYLEARKLFEIHRGGAPIPHAPKVTNIRSIAAGPGGTLLLRQGDNKPRNVGVLYDPATRSVTPVGPGLFKASWGPLQSLEALHYQESGQLLVGVQKKLFTLPFSALGAPAPAAKAAPAGSGVRRFEFVQGTSSKFWEVSREGKRMTVCFGKIGTDGQTKTKSFADDAAALEEVETLIREKTGKGYVEKT